jgi:hypothetical protein
MINNKYINQSINQSIEADKLYLLRLRRRRRRRTDEGRVIWVLEPLDRDRGWSAPASLFHTSNLKCAPCDIRFVTGVGSGI